MRDTLARMDGVAPPEHDRLPSRASPGPPKRSSASGTKSSIAGGVGMVGTPMTILENNCMQSTANSAGYSTGGTLISAFAAYILVSKTTLALHATGMIRSCLVCRR
jgi:hypothetical protein